MSEELIDSDIRMAQTLPSEFYTEEKYFTKQMEEIRQCLQFVGHQSEFDSDMTPIPHLEAILKQPLLRTNHESEKHLLANVCTHRGMILCQEKKNGNSIQCKYHGRTFEKNGKLKHMPGFENVENYPADSDNLPSLNLEAWFGFEFTSLNPSLKLESILQPIEQRLNWWVKDLNLQHDAARDREWDIDANWILYVDNYLEGFHIPFVHPELNNALSKEEYSTECYENAVLQIGMANENDICFEIPDDAVDAGKRVAAYYWWLYPNMMMNIYPWGVSMNIIVPTSVNTTKILFRSYVQNPELLEMGAGALLDKVELQDQNVVEGCMRGLRSRLYHRGRYSAIHEKGVHHFHMKLTR